MKHTPAQNKPMHYEVLVIGAGPAGCSAAFDLASNGRSVAILDKCNFPRLKPCAGGLTVKTLQRLRYSVAPVIQKVVTGLDIGYKQEKRIFFSSGHPICALTVREQFDHFCLQQTLNAGAQFHKGTLNSIIESDRAIEATCSDGTTFQAKYLIGADGANSTVRKKLFPQLHMQRAYAMEALVPNRYLKEPPPQMTFDFFVIPQGYAWLFPKGNHVNIGLYTNIKNEDFCRQTLLSYAQKALGTQEIEQFVGFPLGIHAFRNRPLASQRALLVGDAAGTVETMMGEGIYNAIASGQLAAQTLEKILSGSYPNRLDQIWPEALQPILKDLKATDFFARQFYRFPQFGFQTLSFWPFRKALMAGYAAGLPFYKIRNRVLFPTFMRPVKDLRLK